MNPISIITANDGELLAIAGGNYRIVLSGAQTGQTYSVIEMNVPDGGGPIPHKHPGFSESFFVLEGEVRFRADGVDILARKGDMVTIPKDGPVHCFKNESGRAAKLLCTVVPSGLDDFFKAAASAAESASDRESLKVKMETLSAEYGQQLFPPDYFK